MFAKASRSQTRLSLAHLALMVPWVALVIDAWAPIRDNSFLWHVRAGSVQRAAGSVVTSDLFSFVASGEPWRTQSWLAELLYALGEEVSGLRFVPILILGVSLVSFVAVGLVAYRYSRSVSVTVLILVLSTILLISFLVPRPVIFSFALFPLVILAWGSDRTRFTLPFLFWLWASVHGSFLIGLGWIALSIFSSRQWRRLPVAVISGIMTLFTAHGLGILFVLLEFAEAGESLSLLSEWRRPEIGSLIFAPFGVGILLLAVGAARRRLGARDLVLMIPFLILGLSSTRALPPAWIGLTPLIAASLRGLWQDLPRRFSPASAAVFGVFTLVMPFLVADDGTLDADRFPLVAAEHLAPLRTFHDDVVGGYLIWAKWPVVEVFIDDRAELYDERLVEFVAVRDGDEDWREMFERDGIEQVLLRDDAGLVDKLRNAGWNVVHKSDGFVILR